MATILSIEDFFEIKPIIRIFTIDTNFRDTISPLIDRFFSAGAVNSLN